MNRCALLAGMLSVAFAVSAQAAEFETALDEAPSASLAADEIEAPNFKVGSTVHLDGLMRQYTAESRYGTFPAYGRSALAVRRQEVAALTTLSKTTDVDLIAKNVGRNIESSLATVGQAVKNPIKTVVGIPKGIGNLFKGYASRAQEMGKGSNKKHGGGDGKGESAASRYASRYFGVNAAQRRWYAELGVDPYTSNAVLRAAVEKVAKKDAAVGFGLKFAGIPGLPHAGELRRAMNAIYNEDPATLRKRQREVLTGYGLTAEEIDGFENTLLLSPTRQQLLLESARTLEGVEGRGELFRHAMSVTTEEELQVFLASAGMLARVHARQPLARVVPGLRLPAGVEASGRIVVAGAFDAVRWTEEVAGYEAAARTLLPATAPARELWILGSVSPTALSALTASGWTVHPDAAHLLAAAD